MKKQYKTKFYVVIFLVVIFVSLFFKNEVYGVPEGYAEDLGPALADSQGNWYLSFYGGIGLGGGQIYPDSGKLSYDDFTINEKFGWCEYNYKGINCVVVAAATRELLNTGNYPKQDWIHYFKYARPANNWTPDIVQFKFADQSIDTNVYNAIILDSCGVSMNPTSDEWKKPANSQWLDVYTCKDEKNNPNQKKNELFNQKQVYVSDSGVFPSNAGTTKGAGLGNFILNLFATIFNFLGDYLQRAIVASGTETSWEEVELTYTRSEIESNSELNEEIQVSNPTYSVSTSIETEANTNIIKNANISSTIDNRNGAKETVYTADTEIPVIPIELYSSSIDKVNLLDIDFYSTTNDNPNKMWNFIKSIVSSFGHAVLYISAALLMTMLIWRSILLVISSLGDNPAGAARSRQVMDNLVKSVILIVGVYVIMTLMLYLYQNVLKLVMNGNDSFYLIRANVENAYAFNTNITGYLKYMTLTTNSLAAFGYSLLYLIIAIVNLIWFFFMIVRVFAIAGLTIIAPFTAVMTMNGNTSQGKSHVRNILQFRNWLKIYLIFMWIPLVIVILQRIMLYIA